MNAASKSTPQLLAELSGLLRGLPGSAAPLANALTVQAMGFQVFGRTDAVDLLARHPLALSPSPHVLSAPGALAVLDVTPEGRPVGVFADVMDGVLARLWVAGPVVDDAATEPGVPVASDDFLTQDRTHCAGDPIDFPSLDALAWPQVQACAAEALQTVAEPAAASSSRAVVVRAFSSGDGFAVLYALRVLSPEVPRVAHRRWAVAVGRIGADGALLHRRIAVSDAWPVPAHVFF
ncbi:hypothetical protein [Roseateles violae]|uniref:Uncharacterized protein n=1 Tax=Roseateles violae TaxID=3058042 RepID=A0ABT8DSQ9_9BURK|nr:hypothetical protein [Pelomonas sp. PFR6]MDN3919382.1 hypothetical protein [Pelomonas sp. PFR6]